MKIYLETVEKLYNYIITNKIEESFIINFKLNNVEKSITLTSNNGKWFINQSLEYSITKVNTNSQDNSININDIFTLKYEDTTIIIYCIDLFNNNYSDLSILNKEAILISKDNNSDICHNYILHNIQIKKENNNYYYIDDNKEGFINNIKSNKEKIDYGDIIFIKGLKIIFMKDFIRLLGVKYNNTLLQNYNKEKVDYTKYSTTTEQEKNATLYNEDDLFFHTPQLKFNVKETKITIDAPPSKNTNEELPIILTLGTSIMMAGTSLLTGWTSINNIINKTLTVKEALPSLLISFTMIVGSVVFPLISNKIQKRNANRKEKNRQEKYLKYLDDKKVLIQNTINEQAKILNQNYLSVNDIVKNLNENTLKLWNKEITDKDFLTVRLGIGNKEAEIKIDAPNEEFSLDEDNLKKNALELSNTPCMMKDVPITVSLIENKIFPIILECQNKTDYINGIILQLITTYSPNDLKLIFFLDNNTLEEYSYAKYLNHTLSEDKNTRFFATSEEEMKDISIYLENIYNTRKAQKNEIDEDKKTENDNKKEYYKNNSPYYLIITNSFKLAKDQSIVNKILETNSNYGFSLLLIESNLKNLPSKCDRFAKITDSNSGLFGKDLSQKDQATYKAEYLTDSNMENIVTKISNIPISSLSSESVLPQLLEFLEMYNVGKIEQLNILSKWQTNKSTNSLAAPVGVYKSGNKFDIDLHEKAHGPHGLIAGMTGSGKSEFIITYILSMAINYHPDDVQFVLIDYKGGGLAGAFENRETKVSLPHVVGTITNLDTNEMNRTLVSINSELNRRQKIFNEVREKVGESTIDIYKYQKLYKEGIIKEPISHLIIVCDEFAELKMNQPEFMDELISTARIGRSLGVHLVLATQKPSGIVNDQIWSNTRFRVCLKVQSSSDSMEMLKRSEAANIKEVGRFYLQVGFDELFEMGQSSWAGAKYHPSEKFIKKTNDSIDIIDNSGNIIKSLNDISSTDTQNDYGDQLSNIVKYIYNLSIKENINFHKLWLPKIPEEIFLSDIIKKYQYNRSNNDVIGIIGEYDNPKEQMQGLFSVNFSKTGNTAVIGIPGSGKENMITTLITSLISYYTPEELNIYILDFGSETLKMFENIPQIGDIVFSQEKEKLSSLLSYLEKEIEKRKQLFSEFNGNYNDYIKNSGKKIPMIITFINNYDSLMENYESEYGGLLYYLFREGIKYGILFVIAANSTGSIRSSAIQYFSNEYALQLSDPFDYKFNFNAPSGLIPSKCLGRGIASINDGVYEYQTAYVYNKDNIYEYIKQIKEKLISKYGDIKAKKIPQVPDKITSEILLKYMKDIKRIPLGVDINEISLYYHDFTVNKINQITGNNILSKPYMICGIIESLNMLNNINIEFIDTQGCMSLSEDEGNYYSSDFDTNFDKIINNVSDDTKNHFIFLFGIKDFLDSISEETKNKYITLLDTIKSKDNITLLIIDDYSSFKKITLEKWYIDNVNTNSGIWIGSGINTQVSIEISNMNSQDANQEIDGLFYAIEKGEYKVIKGIGEE